MLPIHGSSAPDVVLAKVLSLDLSSAALSVCLASVNKDGAPAYYRLNFTDPVRVEFENVIRDTREHLTNDDIVLRPFDVGSKPDRHEVEVLSIGETPEVKTQLDPLDSLVDLATFVHDDPAFLTG